MSHEAVTYRVFLDEVEVGVWIHDEPLVLAGWQQADRAHALRFIRNDSSWCINNMQTEGELWLRAGITLPFDSVDSVFCNLCARVRLEPALAEVV